MSKQSSNKAIVSMMRAAMAGVLLVLSSTSALALSAEAMALQHTPSHSMMQGIRYAQSGPDQKRSIRSRREIMEEVKRRYRGAEVLKIALNRSRTSYNVRVLMPSGKVRSLQVSALR